MPILGKQIFFYKNKHYHSKKREKKYPDVFFVLLSLHVQRAAFQMCRETTYFMKRDDS